jgi:hypothetical protein
MLAPGPGPCTRPRRGNGRPTSPSWGNTSGRPGMWGWFMTWVVSAGQEPAGQAAPVDRTARPTPLLPPGDPQLPTPWQCRLESWDRWMLHRVISLSVVGSVRRTSSSSRPGSRTWRAGRAGPPGRPPGPLMVVWPPGTARRASGPGACQAWSVGWCGHRSGSPACPLGVGVLVVGAGARLGEVGAVGPGAAGGATSAPPAIRRLTRSENRVGSAVSSRVLRRLRRPGR